MSKENSLVLKEAANYWQQGKTLEAGRLIFENIAPVMRPSWASSILEALVKRTAIIFPPIDNILQIAGQPSQWHNAHEAFSVLRRSTFEIKRFRPLSLEQEILLTIVSTAELVAKIIYNATNPPDPFDEDAGWWIARSLKEILDLLDDREFSESMWLLLCSDKPTEFNGDGDLF